MEVTSSCCHGNNLHIEVYSSCMRSLSKPLSVMMDADR